MSVKDMSWLSKPLPDALLRVISNGAGVQSMVMSLMAALGEIGPRPDVMIHAQTPDPQIVHDNLAWLEAETKRLTNGQMDAVTVCHGDLAADVLTPRPGRQRASIPVFTKADDGAIGMVQRQCTMTYKIEPVTQEIRRRLGLKKHQRGPKKPVVEVWIGISMDERQRVKESGKSYIQNRFPLIELGMTRQDCIKWFQARYPGRPLVKSSCYFCPYHSNSEWQRIQREDPKSWADAVAFDAALRDSKRAELFNGSPYLHRSCVPLSEADLNDHDPRQEQLFGFDNECDGMCGV